MSTVLITGAAGGIGLATARALTSAGHRVIATGRTLDSLAGVPAVERLVLDVTDARSIADAADRAGQVDVLVNNAGIAAVGPVEQMPDDALERLFAVNVLGPLRTTAAFLPGMRARHDGLIVNVSSAVAHAPIPLMGGYAASKAALEALSQALRFELLGTGVRVALVQPGLVDTSAGDRSPVHLDATDAHYAAVAGALATLDQQASPPELVADAIVGIVDGAPGAFRTPVGPDALQLLGARQGMTDDDFLPMLESMFGLPPTG